jgi:hypothetical protein
MKAMLTGCFELVEDSDLRVTGSSQSMILYCKDCDSFFFSKACGGRNIFHSNVIYHPTDGNCIVAEYPDNGYHYDCNHSTMFRVTRVALLKELLGH